MPLLILIHGFLGRSRDYTFLLPLKKHFRLLLLDFSGNTPYSQGILKNTPVYYCREHSFTNLTQEILTLIKRHIQSNNYSKVFAIGYSMGGRLLLAMLEQEPFLFQKIILESTGLGYTNEQEKKDRAKQDQNTLKKWQKQDFNSFLKKWYAQPIFCSLQNKKALKQTLILKHRLSSYNKIKCLQKIFSECSPSCHPYFLPTLQQFSQTKNNSKKILYLAGELDAKYFSIALEIKKNIPQAKVKIIANCGHPIKIENQLAYQKIILPFLLS